MILRGIRIVIHEEFQEEGICNESVGATSNVVRMLGPYAWAVPHGSTEGNVRIGGEKGGGDVKSAQEDGSMVPPDARGVGWGARQLHTLLVQVGPIALMGGHTVRGEAVTTTC